MNHKENQLLYQSRGRFFNNFLENQINKPLKLIFHVPSFEARFLHTEMEQLQNRSDKLIMSGRLENAATEKEKR